MRKMIAICSVVGYTIHVMEERSEKEIELARERKICAYEIVHGVMWVSDRVRMRVGGLGMGEWELGHGMDVSEMSLATFWHKI